MNCVCRLLAIINFNEKRHPNLSVEESPFNTTGPINLALATGTSGGKARVGVGNYGHHRVWFSVFFIINYFFAEKK